ncbi:DJ-1/PfpI family protein [Bosea sp. ASV33]|uniref:DJ-1/PfpI family protein n=1 Tax=Bosea sp. ASV33 TaxID=2795106 RepID=UPI0018EDA261|nr:DJ-1/PfpI family protein [Bosea sp. ASV33]
MKIGIPVYDEVDMLDVTGPFEMFDWAGFEVELLAENAGLKRFRSQGFSFEVRQTFVSAPRYDVVWVPGGDPKMLARIIGDPQSAYLSFLIIQARTARFMCSVCEGAMLLAAAGLLDGYRATTHWAFLSCFPQRFPNVVVEEGYPRFVRDRDRLTGGGISSGLDEALELIRLLAGEAVAEDVQQSTQYYPNPPVNSTLPAPPGECPVPWI